MEQQILNQRTIFVHHSTDGEPEWLIVQPVDHHDIDGLEEEIRELEARTPTPFVLVALHISEWNHELSPWAAASVFKNKPFGNGAKDTLAFVEGELLTRFPARHVCLGGYSLAGLFALWGGYSSTRYDAIAAVSPSVWFPRWIEFAQASTMQAGSVYLSLGDKEPKARNPLMATVGTCIERQHALLTCTKTLEWNVGNHFADNALRMAKALAWVLNGEPAHRPQ